MSAASQVATAVIGAILALAFAALGASKVAKTASMRARAEHVGFSAESYQLIGAAEILGAAGVVAGLFSPSVGFAAGAGLLILLAGAVRTHLRVGDGGAELAPAALFALGAVAYLVALGAS